MPYKPVLAVVIGGEVCRPGWVRTSQGRIVACGAGAPPAPTDIDLPNSVVVPGFVDMHVHGGGGASYLDAGHIAQAAEFHRRHGTTTTLASLVTVPLLLAKRLNLPSPGDAEQRWEAAQYACQNSEMLGGMSMRFLRSNV